MSNGFRGKGSLGAALAFFAVGVAAVMLTCRRGEPPEHNVILIVIDTLRADHLGCYGYHRDTSPRMDAFSREATRYTRSFASSPWTLPSHASMFTGLAPFEHGAVTVEVSEPKENVRALSRRRLTLAEAFQHQGARTGGVVANHIFLTEKWGVGQGFDTYDVKWDLAPQVNERVYRWLDANEREPFFLFVNYMDTHRPYNATPRPGFLDPPAVQDKGELLDELYEAVMPGAAPAPPELREQVIAQYDTGIANVDEQIGVLIQSLKDRGLYENTLLIVTSDHGEYFGEHGLVEHSKDIYQEALWAPLLIKNPGQREGSVSDEVVSSMDLPNLIFSQFEGKFAEKNLARFPARPGNHLTLAENYYTRTKDLFDERWGKRFQRVRTVAYQWPYKYIHSSDGQHELFNLADDPQEAQNLYDGESERAEAMQRELKHFLAMNAPADGEEGRVPHLTPEEIERMRAMGYAK